MCPVHSGVIEDSWAGLYIFFLACFYYNLQVFYEDVITPSDFCEVLVAITVLDM